jgi:hypothetical protein
MRIARSCTRPAKHLRLNGSLPAFLLSIFLVPWADAEDADVLRIVIDHPPKDCEDHQPDWGCHNEAHHSFVVDGKALPDRKALDGALRMAAGGNEKSKSSGRKVWVQAEERIAYELVWSLLESCAKAGLHRFVWTAAALSGEKAAAKRPDWRRSPAEVWICIDETMTTRLEYGPYIAEDRELLEALRAWAWGASRALDYLETDKAVDAKQVGIEGLSRYGKAALVAMACDQRFAIGFIGSSGAELVVPAGSIPFPSAHPAPRA